MMSYPMLDYDLETLKNTPEFQDQSFGISRIQRFMGIGYNRASHLVDEAMEIGILVRDKECDWLVRLAKQS
ncbi:hypothetical protein F0225_11505 [Vibrio pectenicida]|nr:hypothetical protein [Vibrio pectenicida]NOH71959.1 hypothetical protein [Vibrio pectenicida]